MPMRSQSAVSHSWVSEGSLDAPSCNPSLQPEGSWVSTQEPCWSHHSSLGDSVKMPSYRELYEENRRLKTADQELHEENRQLKMELTQMRGELAAYRRMCDAQSRPEYLHYSYTASEYGGSQNGYGYCNYDGCR